MATRWAATAGTRYWGLRAYFGWLVDEGELDRSPLDRVNPPVIEERSPGVLSDADIIALLKASRQWRLVTIHEDVASGKEMRKRPGLNAALAAVTTAAHALVVAKVDRLSRSMKDFTDLLDRAQREG